MASSTVNGFNVFQSRRLFQVETLPLCYTLFFVWDFFAVALSGNVSSVLYKIISEARLLEPSFSTNTNRMALLGGIMAALILHERHVQLEARTSTIQGVVGRAAKRILLLASLLVGISLLTGVLQTVPKPWVAMWITLAMITSVGGRLAISIPLHAAFRRGTLSDRIAIIGSGPQASQLMRQMKSAKGAKTHEIIGVFDDHPEHASDFDHSISALLDMGRNGRVDRVVLALPPSDYEKIDTLVHRLRALDVEVLHATSMFGQIEAEAAVDYIAGTPVTVLSRRPIRQWGLLMKAMVDRLLAGAALTLLCLPLAAIALVIRLDSKGPVLFRQPRHGWNGRVFQVYKFRTMHWGGNGLGDGGVQTRRGDSRITRVGGFLRRTSLDELPQLLNILDGTMSLVGPRPHPIFMRTEQLLCEDIIPEYQHRHRVKPGITGWPQVNGYRGATEFAEQVRKRVEYDLHYIDNWSMVFDLKILILTPLKIIFSRANAF